MFLGAFGVCTKVSNPWRPKSRKKRTILILGAKDLKPLCIRQLAMAIRNFSATASSVIKHQEHLLCCDCGIIVALFTGYVTGLLHASTFILKTLVMV